MAKNRTCDRRVDCRDGSDEHGCAYWTSSCWPEQFRCLDRTCVDIRHRCDGIWDCVNGEDEMSCAASCLPSEVECDGSCLPAVRRCDGVVDWGQGEDEQDCQCGEDQVSLALSIVWRTRLLHTII